MARCPGVRDRWRRDPARDPQTARGVGSRAQGECGEGNGEREGRARVAGGFPEALTTGGGEGGSGLRGRDEREVDRRTREGLSDYQGNRPWLPDRAQREGTASERRQGRRQGIQGRRCAGRALGGKGFGGEA